MIFTLQFGDYEFPNQTFEILDLSLDNEINRNVIPRKHGAKIQDPYLKPRKLKVKGYLHNNLAEDTHDQLMDMQEALLAGEEQFKYRNDRYVSCYLRRIRSKMEKGTDKAVMNINLEFIAANPFFYSAAASYSTAEAASGTTHTFDIYSGGNAFSQPKIYICATGGTISDAAQLKNIASDQLFKFRGVIGNGLTMDVDTRELEVLNNLTDGISLYEGDFINLFPGTNSFEYIGDDARVTVEHKYRWW